MRQYFFILGRNSTLSIAEIISVLSLKNVKCSITDTSSEVCVASTNENLDAGKLMKILGGTVKIGEVLDEIGLDESESKFVNIFSADNLLGKYLPKRAGKMHIGLSIYGACGNSQYVAQLERRLKDLNVTIKENIKEKGLKSGFVKVKERFLSSVSVAKNKLLTQGVEIVLIPTDDKILAGKTLAVQEFESFSFRDYFRPQKDKRSGIMPPKLARIMINLANADENAVLLDPFCGSGTILSEAVVLGYKNIVGCDVSAKAVEDTRKNIDWLFRSFPSLDRSKYNLKLVTTDVRYISQKIPVDSVDIIVSEPYLGPPLFRMPEIRIIERLFIELNRLYLNAFTQFAKILKPYGKIVIIFPAFFIDSKMYFLEILEKIKAVGYSTYDLFPKEFQNDSILNTTSRNSILYGSKEQFVKREILGFRKN